MKNNRLLDVAHEIASDLHAVGAIDKVTMREYDASCLKPVPDLSPREIRMLRLKEKVSQSVFAKYLNTSASTIKQWEQGDKHPRGTSLKLLQIVKVNGLAILSE
jgi:putative transcriptional regulator